MPRRPLKYADCPSCRGHYPESCAHQIIHARLDLKREMGKLAAKGITMTIQVGNRVKPDA